MRRMGQPQKMLAGLMFWAILLLSKYGSWFRPWKHGITTLTRSDRTIVHYSSSSSRPRIWLGIFVDRDDEFSRLKWRRTLLNFHNPQDNESNVVWNHRICGVVNPWQEDSSIPEECQMMYTFIMGGAKESVVTPPERWKFETIATNNIDSPMEQRLHKREIYPGDPHDMLIWKHAGNQDFLFQQWLWYQYILQQQQQNNHDMVAYVAQTDIKVLLQLYEFWNDNSRVWERRQIVTYAGYVDPKQDQKSSPYNMHRFSMISMEFLMSSALRKLVWDRRPADMFQHAPKPPSKWDAAWMTNQFVKHYEEQKEDKSTSLRHTSLQGVQPLERFKLEDWDEYQQQHVSYQYSADQMVQVEASPGIKYWQSQGHHGGTAKSATQPRLLLGIFTTDDETERERRQAIRETYLSYYKPNSARICALSELLNSDSSDAKTMQECQIAYTFIMGSNPKGPTERAGPNETLASLVMKDVRLSQDEETNDILHLNIQENMEQGKTPTWFRYATLIAEQEVFFDYILKADSDTLLFPPLFLDAFFDGKLNGRGFPHNARTYGGQPRFKVAWASRLVGPCYFVGQLYWLSTDMAQYVISIPNRSAIDVGFEDMSMGNYVHSHPLPIRRISLHPEDQVYVHPIKNVTEFRGNWTLFLKQEGGK